MGKPKTRRSSDTMEGYVRCEGRSRIRSCIYSSVLCFFLQKHNLGRNRTDTTYHRHRKRLRAAKWHSSCRSSRLPSERTWQLDFPQMITLRPRQRLVADLAER